MALFTMKNENSPCEAFRFCQNKVPNQFPEIDMKYAYGSGNLNLETPNAYLTGVRGGTEISRVFAPPVPPRKADADNGFRIGQKVFHTKFGEGIVLSLEGNSDDARAQINFTRHGTK